MSNSQLKMRADTCALSASAFTLTSAEIPDAVVNLKPVLIECLWNIIIFQCECNKGVMTIYVIMSI